MINLYCANVERDLQDMQLIFKKYAKNAANCEKKGYMFGYKLLHVSKFLKVYIIICISQSPNKKQMVHSN